MRLLLRRDFLSPSPCSQFTIHNGDWFGWFFASLDVFFSTVFVLSIFVFFCRFVDVDPGVNDYSVFSFLTLLPAALHLSSFDS